MSEHGSSNVPVTHVTPLWIYFTVFFALMGFTALTVWVAFHDFGWLNTPIALGIAGFKATIVALFFMHLLHSSRIAQLSAFGAVIWILIMLAFTLQDYLTRPNIVGF